MTCRELVDFLMQYLDAELPEGPLSVFERHLGECPPCQAYLDTYRETIRVSRLACESDQSPVPEDVPDQLVAAILAARARS